MPEDPRVSGREVEIGPLYEAASRPPVNGGFPVDHSHEAPALAALNRRGFVDEFVVRGGRVRVAGTGRSFSTVDLRIRDYYRFEGVSDPDDMSIIYAIEARDGTRGTLTDAYGVYADPAVGAVVDRIPVTPFGPRARWRRALVPAAFGALAVAALVIARGTPRLRRRA